ncbi:1-hydroxycarotenoid 3,4-desaturase CrtD [Lichenicoccus roseus]|uniref:1-hydroxycarotenoid 3,4-desaturase CrtD n=1 Tax=Lichenicoccus roseus TaxID=2683649 RepID=UPI0023F1A623|nr:1-hydroxycarotenoid 3,4-desaturase CrtD [Lichenicoccus roseus]
MTTVLQPLGRRHRVAIIGAGMGGLAAAIDLAHRGVAVTVLERGLQPGGKMRTVAVGNAVLDAGPSVLTMRDVFESLFESTGSALENHVTLRPAERLARHDWLQGPGLDLFADPARSREAIGEFAGAGEARRFDRFRAEIAAMYRTLDATFMRAARPSVLELTRRAGPAALLGISPFTRMATALARHFHDPRLRQLFGRYATYCGSSPYEAPATLMLIAHVEQNGVWLVEGGMHRLAMAMAQRATELGARIRYGEEVRTVAVRGGRASGVVLAGGETITADAVLCNADTAAIAGGLLGPDCADAAAPTPLPARSLSAVTWTMVAETTGFPLIRHNVFFGRDARCEFDDLFARHRLPVSPTVYVCAQDRETADHRPGRPERLLCLVNAPAAADTARLDSTELDECQQRMITRLGRAGLHLRIQASERTSPAEFAALFPGTAGALYGPASHGWAASFRRPGSRSALPGLYLAGGSVHPGPGVPMATLSGRLAAARMLADLASMRSSHPAAMSGGMSMRSRRTGRPASP